jgi:hypothetical protein
VVYLPLSKYESQLGRIIPYVKWKKKSKPPTSHSVVSILSHGLSIILDDLGGPSVEMKRLVDECLK